jgi:hypothetical protein
MKRHYEIMRIMCTKVVNFGDLYEGADGILYVQDAIQFRVKNLASASVLPTYAACRINLIHPSSDNFSQQRLDPEKEFESFAYGIVNHFLSPKRLCHLTCFTYSSNISIMMENPCGLLTTSGVFVKKSYHTTTMTMSSRGIF